MAENIYNDEEPESSPADIGMKIKRHLALIFFTFFNHIIASYPPKFPFRSGSFQDLKRIPLKQYQVPEL
jgi:hypothetical protein